MTETITAGTETTAIGTETTGSSAKRVLIYRLGSLGDMLVALPALHLVAREFPNAERRMLTNFPVNVKAPAAAAILENSGLVQGYFRYAVGTRSPGELLGLWWQLRRWRPEVLVYLGAARGVESARRDARLLRLCGIRWLIGVPLTEDMQQNRWMEAEQVWEPESERAGPEYRSVGGRAAGVAGELGSAVDGSGDGGGGYDDSVGIAKLGALGIRLGCRHTPKRERDRSKCRDQSSGQGLGTGELAKFAGRYCEGVSRACLVAGWSG